MEIRIDAQMQLASACPQPKSAASGKSRRFGLLRETQQFDIECPCRAFFAGRHCELNVIKPDDGPPHARPTVCSMAPKIEWRLSSSISILTVSPGLRNGVRGLPSRIVSTTRCSARQE